MPAALPPSMPGDVVQVTDEQHRLHGLFALVTTVRRWGVGITFQALQGSELVEAYDRLKTKQFVTVGAAQLMPPEVAAARETAQREAARAVRT